MTADFIAADDLIKGRVNDRWTTIVAALLGYTADLRWAGVEHGTPDNSKVWARFSKQVVIEGKSSHSNGEERQRYTAQGLVFVQLFSPKAPAKAWQTLQQVSVIVRNAFTTRAGAVIFRNALINELDPLADNYRINVVTEYEYDYIV